MTGHAPARRNPDGYVAQRILPTGGADQAKGPWLLTAFDEGRGGIFVEVLTDEDVADWVPLYDEQGRSA